MPFNSTDFFKAPWAPGVMNLTHEECVSILEQCQVIRDNYVPAAPYYEPISDMYVQSEYNKIDWTKGINGDTYGVLKGYDPEVNTLGINETGIVYPEVIEEEAPIEEAAPIENPAE
jgi:hypothetical protein